MEKIKVKILGISSHHRRARNTEWLTLYALKAAEKFGRRISEVAEIETKLIDIRERAKGVPTAASCKKVNGFYECSEHGYITEELIPQMAEADGFVFGSPVFTGSYTSKFISLFERLRAGVKGNCYTDKPAGSVSVATMLMGGQDRCLESMDMCIRALGMIPVHALFGCSGISGIPNGPLPGEDKGRVIAAQNDRFAQWSAILVGRRVAEVAVMKKIAKHKLGALYKKEFIQRYSLPFGEESWAWTELDKPDRDYMAGLNSINLKQLDGAVSKQTNPEDNEVVKCKILGFGCDDYRGIDTNWLVINSLKAIEKFGRRITPIGNFETEFIDLTDKKISPCLNCNHYPDIPHGGRPWKGTEYPSQDTYGCVIKNDYFTKELLPRYAESDGVVFGSSVCALSPSITFRLFSERLVTGIWKGWNNLKPMANIAVSYDQEGGEESCLNIMNTCNRWVEGIPVSWPHGTPAKGGILDSKEIAVKNDPMACALSIINGRRIAEFAVMTALAKKELGELYRREFYKVLHPPHGEASWEWSKLDKEEDDYLKSLTPNELAKLGKQ